MTARTARAHPNIALIKYWGKADAAMSLPATGSLSMTLDAFPTTTTVTFGDDASDSLVLGGEPVGGTGLDRMTRFLDIVRELSGERRSASVVSVNAVPTGAGLASSASGFAALALAASAAAGLDLSERDLSRLARRGSGSAARSIVPGVAIWHAGDDASSFAEAVPAPEMAMVVATVDAREKPISSRDAMRATVDTSPFFPAWVESTSASLEVMVDASRRGDLDAMGRLAETNAMRMHALIQSTDPSIRYLTGESLAILDAVATLRAEGVLAYATFDAGPNGCVICTPADAERVAAALADVASVTITRPGPGAVLVDEVVA